MTDVVHAQLLHDLLSPEAAAECGIDAAAADACAVNAEGCQSSPSQLHSSSCCQGQEQSKCGCVEGEDTSSHGRAPSTAPSAASGVGPRGPGLPKDEYRRLKKAGLLPPKDPAIDARKIKGSKAQQLKAAGGSQDVNFKGRLGGMVILYASQTGNAQNLAKDLYEDASEKGFSVEVMDMGTFDFAAFVRRPPPLPVMILISSTWTDGVPPPKAQAAFTALFADKWSPTSFSRLRYAVFGLGNSVYGANFCKAARDLDARLLALGAQRVCTRGENDDDNYRAEVYAKWKDSLWVAHGARVMGNSVQFIENPSDGESEASGSAEEWISDEEESEEADFAGLGDGHQKSPSHICVGCSV